MKKEYMEFAVGVLTVVAALVVFFKVFEPYIWPQVSKLFGSSTPANQK